MGQLSDFLGPHGDPVQVVLRKKGTPVAAIYKDKTQEVRSAALKKEETPNEPTTSKPE